MALVPPSSKYGNASIVLGSGAAGYSHTGDTLETAVASVAIPANTVGLGQLEIITMWSWPTSANAKTFRTRFGLANDLTGTIIRSNGFTTSIVLRDYVLLANQATNSQKSMPAAQATQWGGNANAQATAAIDTTQNTFLVFSIQMASAAETGILENYLVRLIPAV